MKNEERRVKYFAAKAIKEEKGRGEMKILKNGRMKILQRGRKPIASEQKVAKALKRN